MFAFDALRRVKKQVGEMMLMLIRQYFTHEMVIQITDQLGAARTVRLNAPAVDDFGAVIRDEFGDIVRQFDVKSGVYDVHIEEVRDVTSGRELELQQLQALMEAGISVPPEMLIEATNVTGKERLLEFVAGGREKR